MEEEMEKGTLKTMEKETLRTTHPKKETQKGQEMLLISFDHLGLHRSHISMHYIQPYVPFKCILKGVNCTLVYHTKLTKRSYKCRLEYSKKNCNLMCSSSRYIFNLLIFLYSISTTSYFYVHG